MKTKFFAKLASMMMAICMMIGVCVPAYAMESYDSVAESNMEADSIMPRTIPTINLRYGEAQTLTSGITINGKTYIHIGTVNLPNDARIHRIIFSGSFKKADTDHGGGPVSLDLRFIRGGKKIGEYSFNYNTTLGQIRQTELTGLGMNQSIEVWADASSVNPAESNGSIREIYLYSLGFYCD